MMYSLSEPARQLGRSFRLRILLLILILLGLATLSFGAAPEALQRQRLAQVRVPFVENCGQWNDPVAFAASTRNGATLVTRSGELVYSLSGPFGRWGLSESFIAGTPTPQGAHAVATLVAWIHGSDANAWRKNLSSFDEVGLGEVWRGVRVSVRVHGGTTEKVFIVEPGATARAIWMRVEGATHLSIDETGALVVRAGRNTLRFRAPVAYQDRGRRTNAVKVAYVVSGSTYGLRLGRHDPSWPVVIDPLIESTYVGGSAIDIVSALALDPVTGDVLIAGQTESIDFPGATLPDHPPYGGGNYDGFVARLDSTLTHVVSAIYIGGSSDDWVASVAIDPTDGAVLAVGGTRSSDFPVTAGSAQPNNPGTMMNGFAARLDPGLTTVLQATYLGGGGDTWCTAVAFHPQTGELLVAGSTSAFDFPGTSGGAQPGYAGGPGGPLDGFVVRFDPQLSTIHQATYLGGTGDELVNALLIAPVTGEIIVAGATTSSNLPAAAQGAQPVFGGIWDGFVGRLDRNLTQLLQTTYLGGSGSDSVYAVAFHPVTAELIATGRTSSSDFPGTSGGAQSTFGGKTDGFVVRLDPTLTSAKQATYLGGVDDDGLSSIGIRPSTGEILVAGSTSSTDFPAIQGGIQASYAGGLSDGLIARLDAQLRTVRQATFLGGASDDSVSAIVTDGQAGELLVVAGVTSSIDFPVTRPCARCFSSGIDGFVARLTADLSAPPPHEVVRLPGRRPDVRTLRPRDTAPPPGSKQTRARP